MGAFSIYFSGSRFLGFLFRSLEEIDKREQKKARGKKQRTAY